MQESGVRVNYEIAFQAVSRRLEALRRMDWREIPHLEMCTKYHVGFSASALHELAVQGANLKFRGPEAPNPNGLSPTALKSQPSVSPTA